MSFNKKKSIFIFILILTLAAGLLAGCGKKTVEPTATTAPTEAPATEAPAEAEPVITEEPAAEPEAEEPAETEQEQAAEAESAAPAAQEQTETADGNGEVSEAAAVAAVDGEALDADKFVQITTFNRYQYLNMYYQYAQMYSMYGIPLDSLNEQVDELLGESGRERLGLEAIDQLTYDRVLELEAEKDGLEISEEDIYAQLKLMFGYEDTSADEEDVLGMDSFNIGADETDDQSDKNAEFREYAEMVLADSYNGVIPFDYLKDYAKHILLDNTMFDRELSTRVFESEQVYARHILVEDEETAKDLRARLESGEDWDTLASENSLDTSNKDNGGTLGWFGRGVMVSEFEDAAFALEPGEISEPVQTAYGFHIIALDGKEVRPLEGDALTSAQNALYDEWAIGLREKHDIQSYPEVWMDLVPMEPVFEPIVTETEETAEAPETEDIETAETAVDEPAEETAAPVIDIPDEAAAAEEPVEEPAAEEAGIEEEPAENSATEEEPAAEEAAETVETGTDEAAYIASVDGEGIGVDEFVQSVTFSRYQYLSMYNQYAQMYSMYGLPLDSLNAQVEGILGEEGKAELGLTSVNELTYNKVLDLEAEKAGVEVTEDEVYSRLKTMFGYEDPAEEENSLLGMDSFAVDPNETDDDEDKYAAFEEYANMILALGYDGKVSLDYLKNYAKHAMLDDKLFEEEIKDRVFEAEQVNARHILVETEETAKEVIAKLEAGESWDDLASEYNLDSGTDLGWFGRGVMVSEFEEAAFALEPGEISEPVQTQFGYHIISSNGKEMRPLEGTALESAKNEVYAEYSAALRENHDIQDFADIWMAAMPTEPVFEPIVTEAEEEPVEETAEEPTVEETPEAEPVSEEAAEETAEEAVPAQKVIKHRQAAETSEEPVWGPIIHMSVAEDIETTEEESTAEEETEAEVLDLSIVGKVEDLPITDEEFAVTAVFNRYQVLAEYEQSAQIYAMFGIPLDEINASYEAYLGSSEEAKATFGQGTLDNLALFKMAELEAAETGITVSDSEVTAQMKQSFGYTDAEAETESSLGLDSFNLDAEEESEDFEFRAYVDATLDMAFDGKISYDFWKDYVAHNMLINALVEKELENRVFEAEQVHARHILVDDEETANEILSKLETGESWDDLAAEYNLDSGTDLGWFGRGMMVSEFEEAAFALEPGEISQPVKTQFGYHIIASDGKEMRPLEDSALQAAQQEVSNEWYENLLTKYSVESYPEVWMELVPTEPVFEPIVIDYEDGEGIPTFSIGSWDEEEEEEEEDSQTAAETEEEFLLSNDAELEPAEVEAESLAGETAEEELSINNTEQDDSAFLLSNDAENQ